MKDFQIEILRFSEGVGSSRRVDGHDVADIEMTCVAWNSDIAQIMLL